MSCWFTREEVVLADVDNCTDDHDADGGDVESDIGDMGGDGSGNDHDDHHHEVDDLRNSRCSS